MIGVTYSVAYIVHVVIRELARLPKKLNVRLYDTVLVVSITRAVKMFWSRMKG